MARKDPFGRNTSIKCECDTVGQLKPGYADWYDPELELPYVDHAPGECQCVNELAQFARGDGSVRWLCSCCCTFRDKRVVRDGAE